MPIGMQLTVNGESLDGISRKKEKEIERMLEDGEFYVPPIMTLSVFRNNRNPQGFIFTINDEKDGTEMAVRIPTAAMKQIIKDAIDTLES